MMLVVELVEDELDIEPIHRLLDLADDEDLVGRIRDTFDVVECGANTPEDVEALLARMADERGIGIVYEAGLYLAVAPPDVRAEALAGEHPAVAATDAAVVEALVMPRVPSAKWRYWHDAQGVADQVRKGAASAAILCSPVSVAQTRAAATDRARMPQKTTFFTPKPLSGMVFREL